MSQTKYCQPVRWIQIWIGWGLVVLVGIVLMPFFLERVGSNEYMRFQGCMQRLRSDCKPSVAWLIMGLLDQSNYAQDIENQNKTTRSTDSEMTTTSTKDALSSGSNITSHTTRTSSRAPTIITFRPTGMVISQEGYRVVPGAFVDTSVIVEGAQKVQIYYLPQEMAGQDGFKVADLRTVSKGEFRGTFQAPANLPGELEIRAIYAKEQSSLFLIIKQK